MFPKTDRWGRFYWAPADEMGSPGAGQPGGDTEGGNGGGNDAGGGNGAGDGGGGNDPAVGGAAGGDTGEEQPPDTSNLQDWQIFEDPKLTNFAKRIQSPKNAVETAYDLRQKLSNSITVPGENATTEEVAKFNKALGVPESKDGYGVDLSSIENITETEKTFVDNYLDRMHKAGARPAEVQAGLEAMTEYREQFNNQIAQADKEYSDQCEVELRKKWGGDEQYEIQRSRALRAAQMAFADSGEDVMNIRTSDGRLLMDNPVILEGFAKLGTAMTPDSHPVDLPADKSQSLAEERDRLMNESDYWDNPTKQKRAREISEILDGTAPVVGDGRSL